MLGMDDLVVLHLAQLLEALSAHVAGVGTVVAVDFPVNSQLVKRVCLVLAHIALTHRKEANNLQLDTGMYQFVRSSKSSMSM